MPSNFELVSQSRNLSLGNRSVSVSASGRSVPAEHRNASAWRQVAEFLDDQWLAMMGLSRVPRAATQARGGPARGGVSRLGAGLGLPTLPDGNHGDNKSSEVPT